MKIEVSDKEKMVYIWLDHADQENPAVQDSAAVKASMGLLKKFHARSGRPKAKAGEEQ